MFNFNDHLQELRANILSLVLLISVTLIGFVWISIGIYHWLSAWLGMVWGPIVLGLIYFIPIIIVAFIKAFVNPVPPQNPRLSEHADLTLLNMSKVFESLSGRSPFVVASAAIVAGFLATRFPALLTAFSQIVTAYAEDLKTRAARESQSQTSGQHAEKASPGSDREPSDSK